MMINKILPFILLCSTTLFAQEIEIPLAQNVYSKVTSYDELTKYIYQLDRSSDLLEVEEIAQSVQGRKLYALKFSSGDFGKDKTKIKILIFAQQHGNEQSGKEGALLLAEELIKPEYSYLFDKIDLVLVPQVNPDGSEINQRRNANDMDLNRNHLILTEPETHALHQLFDTYLFDVTMDVHEYYPYYEEWMKFGYHKNSDVTVGATTNINVSEKIRDFSNAEVLISLQEFIRENGFSSSEYCPGGPPETNYMRHSTFDINDGRQSLGIQNTFSFIQEGRNGKDGFVENMKLRAEGQKTGMLGLLNFVYHHKKKMMNMVQKERKKLNSPTDNEIVSIQSEHIKNGEILELPILSLLTNTDSVIMVTDYRPVVKSIYTVQKPIGYLIPATSKELVDWAERQALILHPYIPSETDRIEQYTVTAIDSIDFEGDIIVNPSLEVKAGQKELLKGDYLVIPTAQLKGNMVVLALEPKSMLGLATYKQFSELLKNGEPFPVLRQMTNK